MTADHAPTTPDPASDPSVARVRTVFRTADATFVVVAPAGTEVVHLDSVGDISF